MKRALVPISCLLVLALALLVVAVLLFRSAEVTRLSGEIATLRGKMQVKDELVSNLCEINDQITDESNTYIISHPPFAGKPWTVEKYWRQSEIWVALVSYSSRIAAEDVKAQLESGELKVRDLFR